MQTASTDQVGLAPPAWAGAEKAESVPTDHAAAIGAVGTAKTVDKIVLTERPRPTAEVHEPTEDSHFRYDVDPEQSFGLTAAEIDAKYREARQAARDKVREFEGQRDLTAQEEDQIGKFNEALINIGNNELGVDLSNRVTPLKHIHIFPRPEDYSAAVVDQIKVRPPGRGVLLPSAGILVMDRRDSLDTIYGVLHEEVHDLSQAQVKPVLGRDALGNVSVDIAYSEHTTGYMNLGRATPHGGNEAVTDMLTHRGMVASGLGRIVPGYAVSSLLLGGVIEDTANNLSTRSNVVHPQDVENLITRGMLVADTTGIEMINRALSPNAVKAIMNTPGSLYSSEAAGVASDIRSPSATRALWARDAGVDVGWFTWR